MKLIQLITSASLLFALASASAIHHVRSDAVSARHAELARSLGPATRLTKRCKAKTPPKSSGSAHKPASTTSSKKGAATPAPPKSTPKASPPPANSPKGVINVSSCGPTGATAKTSKTSGPNGSMDFLNRGLTGGGWNPCHITVDQLITQDLSTAIKQNGSPFKSCSQYVSLFNKYGNQNGLPPILLASIAMQESGCNPGSVGGGGEQGLMQITRDKCGGRSDRDCQDPDYNIRTGAAFFADTLRSNNGGVLETMGDYNGWRRGMTFADATAARNSACCTCQNNADYLQQVFNGWLQNVDGSSLGKFFNLQSC